MSAIEDVAAERRRQIEEEGWSAAHDDGHEDGELAWGAVCYAAPELVFKRADYATAVMFCDPWPWDIEWDKRVYDGNSLHGPVAYEGKTRREMLVKAAALIVAEIERLDRLIL